MGMDLSLEEAARDLGASEFETFRDVTLPYILPGLHPDYYYHLQCPLMMW